MTIKLPPFLPIPGSRGPPSPSQTGAQGAGDPRGPSWTMTTPPHQISSGNRSWKNRWDHLNIKKVPYSAAKLAEKNRDRKIGTAMICRSLGFGSVISRINTNSTQISIATTTATVILACHRSQQCWFQFRKTTKFFERDKINQNFVSIVCICSVNLLCYLFGEIYLYFSWIVHTKKNLPIPDLTLKNWGSEMIGKKSKNWPINRGRRSDLAALVP